MNLPAVGEPSSSLPAAGEPSSSLPAAGEPSSSLPAVLAIDGGNSKTDLALVTADGTLLASLRGPGASHEEFGMPEAMRLLAGMVRQLAALAGQLCEGPVARHTSACLAGADLPEEEAQLTDAVRRQGWSLTSSVVNDTFAVLRAGLPAGCSWGVGVTCGAGINCVGVAPDGRTTRYLAFGELSGDWGGGEGLGRAIMWHAIRAEDGRGRPTALREAVAAFFGMTSMHDVAVALHLRELSEDDLLGLPAVLLEAARAGDPVAVEIVERQAEEVCVMAVTAMRRLGLDSVPGTAVVLGGGVLEARDPLLISAIERRLASAAPAALPRVVGTSPVIGAAQLGLDHLGAEPGTHRRLRVTRLPTSSWRVIGLGSPQVSRLATGIRNTRNIVTLAHISVMVTRTARHAAVIFRTYHDIPHGHAERAARAAGKVLSSLGDHPRKSKLSARWHP